MSEIWKGLKSPALKLYTWAVGLKRALVESGVISESFALPRFGLPESFLFRDLEKVKEMVAFLKLKLESHEAQLAIKTYQDALQGSDPKLAEGVDVATQAGRTISKPMAPFELAAQEMVDRLERVFPDIEKEYIQ